VNCLPSLPFPAPHRRCAVLSWLVDLYPVTKLILPNFTRHTRVIPSTSHRAGASCRCLHPDRVSAIDFPSFGLCRAARWRNSSARVGSDPRWPRMAPAALAASGGFWKTGKAEHRRRLRMGAGQMITIIFDLWIATCFLSCTSIMNLFLEIGYFFSFMKSTGYRMKSTGSNKTLLPFAFLPSFHSCSCFSPSLAWYLSLCISFPAATTTSQLIPSSCH